MAMGHFEIAVLLVITGLAALHSAEAEKCSGKTVELVAQPMQKSILSPNYPEKYETNDDCKYIIKRALPGDNYMMQFIAVDFDLNDYNMDCNTDYVAIYEGRSTSGIPKEKWCGGRTTIFKTQSVNVTLHFVSDNILTAKGFAIFFSQVEFANAECTEAASEPIKVGNFPVYESFTGSRNHKCHWKVQASDPDQKLLIEMFKPSSISCNDGLYNFYEGDSTEGHVSYQYCSTTSPFSQMYLQSSSTSIVFHPNEHSKSVHDFDDMILKFSTYTHTYKCTKTNHATMGVNGAPVIFSLPHVKNASDFTCPVLILPAEEKKSLRLDVMGTTNAEARCVDNLVTVTDADNGVEIAKECNAGSYNPVYRQTKLAGILVEAKTDEKIYLRASAVPMECNGHQKSRTAYTDLSIKESIPSVAGFPNLARCKYLISASGAMDKVHLTVTWDPAYTEKDLDGSKGDRLFIYEGDHDEGKVLFTGQQMKGSTPINMTVISEGQHMLVVLDTDARITGQPVHIKYHAIPGGNQCPEGIQHIHVSSSPKTITSPNYPDALPLHQTCMYHLMSDDPEKQIVVEVLEADLPSHCENFLTVVDGDSGQSESYTTLGRVCGQDRPVFKVPKNDVTLITHSEDSVGPGGWKVKVYLEERSTSSAISIQQLFNSCLVVATCYIMTLNLVY